MGQKLGGKCIERSKMRKPGIIFPIVMVITLLFAACSEQEDVLESDAVAMIDTVVPEPRIEFGFNLDSFVVHQGIIQNNQFLADILLKYHVTYPEITQAVEIAERDSVFDIRKIKADRDYMVLCNTDSLGKAVCFIYQESAVRYVVFDFRDSMNVYVGEKDVTVVEREASGTIETSLWDAMVNSDLSPALVVDIADIFAWTIDFYTVQKGDKFKVIFDENYVEDDFVGIGDIKAIMFEYRSEPFYAFAYEQDSTMAFFDERGMGLKKAFLKAPVEFSRISSGYSSSRVHPVTGQTKAHLGTDYAAPEGTPIVTVGDGVVLEAQYSQYNGNYVKVKHNDIVTTQYLHMSKIGEGIKAGISVKQGQVIGYVGSTGLATGPHVCFRYWKNGEQVDHRQEKFESSEPIHEDIKEAYNAYIEDVKVRLDAIGASDL